jgi:hypothetical protein
MNGARSTADEVYELAVKPLPLSERLKLATLILSAIPPEAVVDYSEAWSEEDTREFSAASWRAVAAQVNDQEKDGPAG